MTKQQKQFYSLFAAHGTGEARVAIEPQELMVLLYIALHDLGREEPRQGNSACRAVAQKGFYHITPHDMETLPSLSADDCYACMQACGITDPNDVIFLYLKNLSDLYRRRVKYYSILQTQPFPVQEQIVPRGLLEYGRCSDTLLADWMEWRKWTFDVDNRSAQETGYVFEPLFNSCMGGEARAAAGSPVKRLDDSGHPTDRGRQIDCYVEERQEVYELKMRVTTAASGQGRFSEEMRFPIEAQAARLTPILIVFDGTPSVLLTRLQAQFLAHGGRCYVGHAAWEFLKQSAGAEMGLFIDKYIYPPINAMSQRIDARPQDITLHQEKGRLTITGPRGEYIITRREAQSSDRDASNLSFLSKPAD